MIEKHTNGTQARHILHLAANILVGYRLNSHMAPKQFVIYRNNK